MPSYAPQSFSASQSFAAERQQHAEKPENSTTTTKGKGAVIIGAGPAGLMAAQLLLEQGVSVDLFEAMPTPARKFLYAGKSGMNISHTEDTSQFLTRYSTCSTSDAHRHLLSAVRGFDNIQVKHWVESMGIETFTGSSGRLFPVGMKAAPLLRSWLNYLQRLGLRLHTRHRWLGWQKNQLLFQTPNGETQCQASVLLLALGGGSWKKLGSDGLWQPWLSQRGILLSPLQPANCAFNVEWPTPFAQQFSGTPVKGVTLYSQNREGMPINRSGDLMISSTGLEGGLIYGLSAVLRDRIREQGSAELQIDLLPARSQEMITEALRYRGKRSVSHCLKQLKLSPVKQALLKLLTDKATFQQPELLAAAIKALPLKLTTCQAIDRAISTAGGVQFDQLDEYLMLKQQPGLFFAGEMLDWEAPTGGYLLTACLATGRRAGEGMLRILKHGNH